MEFAATIFPLEEPLQASSSLHRVSEILVNQVQGFTHKATSTIVQLQSDAAKVKDQLEKTLQDAKALKGKLALAQRQNKALQEELKAQASYKLVTDELKAEVVDLQEAKDILTQQCDVNDKLIQSMLAWQAPAPSQVQMETTIKRLEAELQALKSSQFSSSTAPSSSTFPAQTTIPIHMESHQPSLSPPTSTPYTNEPPISIPSTSSPPKDKQVEGYS